MDAAVVDNVTAADAASQQQQQQQQQQPIAGSKFEIVTKEMGSAEGSKKRKLSLSGDVEEDDSIAASP